MAGVLGRRGSRGAGLPGPQSVLSCLVRPGAGHGAVHPCRHDQGGRRPGLVVRRRVPDRDPAVDDAGDRAGRGADRRGLRLHVVAVRDRGQPPASTARVGSGRARRADRGAELLADPRVDQVLSGARRALGALRRVPVAAPGRPRARRDRRNVAGERRAPAGQHRAAAGTRRAPRSPADRHAPAAAAAAGPPAAAAGPPAAAAARPPPQLARPQAAVSRSARLASPRSPPPPGRVRSRSP